MVESLWVHVPTPEVMVRLVGPSTLQHVLFLPERLMQETEPTIRGLTEFQTLYQLLRQIDELQDIGSGLLESHVLSMLATCVETNLNRELRGSSTDAYGNVYLHQTGFESSIIDHGAEQIEELMQAAAAPVVCTLYAPLHGFHIDDFGVHVDFAKGLSVVLEGEVPGRVLIAELRGRDSFYVRNRASYYLRVMFIPRIEIEITVPVLQKRRLQLRLFWSHFGSNSEVGLHQRTLPSISTCLGYHQDTM
jgi:hypothetical protein